jgi:stage III sporulation protein AG
MDGVGEVEAWVTLSAGEEKVLYQEKASDVTKLQEADSVGGTRLEQSEKIQNEVLLDKSGNPYIIQILQPQVEGVLVVAEGADNGTVKKNITEAVQVLFGIESHRIKVAKKKVEE